MNSVILKDYLKVQEEYKATAATITPGMLLELTDANLVQAHSGASEPVYPMFALEDELQGKGIDDVYDASAKVQVWIPTRGDEVNAILAAGENVVVGDFLESDGHGRLQKWVPEVAVSSASPVNPSPIVGIAIEAKDLSGSGATDARIQVKIL